MPQMARKQLYFYILFTIIATNSFISGVYSSATFTLVNKCSFTVWPGILSNAGISPLSTTGFALQPAESKAVNAPASWGGRFWARTHCTTDPTTGKFSCLTGDCGSEKVECAGGGANPPATLAEFKLDGDSDKDFYDVSLVDGYNLPMLVVPQGGPGGANCTATGCVSDLNSNCPNELKVTSSNNGESVACRSACEAFKSDQYCCSGAYGTPDACKPSQYSAAFKSACPHAYSYAYDDRTSTFTCGTGADYVITFCPAPNSSKKSSSSTQNPDTETNNNNSSPMDGNMIYEGALEDASSAPSTYRHVSGVAVAVLAAMWRLCQLL